MSALLLVCPVTAEEPVEQFLAALQEAGLDDLAIDYLDSLESNKLLDEQFRQTLGFRRGQILLERARADRDLVARSKTLAAAAQSLQQFVQQNGDHPDANAARVELRNILLERARMAMLQAERVQDESQSSKFLSDAKQLFDQAAQEHSEREAEIRDELTKIGAKPTDSEQIAKRDSLRDEYVQTKLVYATILFEAAETQKGNKAEYDKGLTTAAARLKEVAKTYRRYFVGLVAAHLEGRCYQQMGDCKKALVVFEELLESPPQGGPLGDLRTKNIHQAIQCYAHLDQFEKGVELAEAHLRSGPASEPRNVDSQNLRFTLATLYLEENEENPSKELVSAARKQLNVLVKTPGLHRGAARKLLADIIALNGREEVAEANMEAPEDFRSAESAAEIAMAEMQEAQSLLTLLRPKVDSVSEPTRKQEIQQQISESEKTVATMSERVATLLSHALNLAGPTVTEQQRNAIRYRLAFVWYQTGELWDAAVMAGFVAKHYPEDPFGMPCGQLAMVCFQRLFNDAPQTDRAFETAHLTSTAETIANNWPDDKLAEQALMILVKFMVADGRLEIAERYLDRIPTESPRRAQAELTTGQAIWQAYQAGMRLKNRAAAGEKLDEDVPDQATLEERKSRAEATLTAGIDRMRKGQPSLALLNAMVGLAQIYVDTDRASEAIKLLEDPQLGPATLVAKKSPITNSDRFVSDVYRTQLRAYLALAAASTSPQAAMAKASEIMDQMGKSLGGSEEGERKVVSIYVALATDLREQLEIAPPEKRQTMTAGIGAFLQEVAKTTNRFDILNWVADMYTGLGDGMSTNATPLSSVAQQYYEQSVATYRRIVEGAESGTITLDERYLVQLRMRMAKTLVSLGKPAEAIQLFQEVLSEQNSLLNVQVEAAQALQDAGRDDPRMYHKAVMGEGKDATTKKNVIWGWNRIGQVTGRQMSKDDVSRQRFAPMFHQSRLGIAECRLRQGLTKNGSDREKYLGQAKRAIETTQGLYPDLGGPAFEPRYIALLKEVNSELGQ